MDVIRVIVEELNIQGKLEGPEGQRHAINLYTMQTVERILPRDMHWNGVRP